MGSLVDLDDDFRVVDGTEEVRYTVVSDRIDDRETLIEEAFRRPLNFKEQAVSGGTYTSARIVWDLPTKLLKQAGVMPKPGDVLTDQEEGTAWTVLEVDRTAFGHWRSLQTIALAIAFDLRELVEIWTPINRQDAASARLAVPAPKYLNLSARIQEVQADVATERGRRGTRRQYTVFVERQISVTLGEDTLRDSEGNVYEIRGYQNAERLDELPQLTVERVP